MRVLVVGGTGLIGRQVSALLEQQGHSVNAASRSRGVNSVTGEGLEEALRGADVLVDLTNSPTLEDQPVAAADVAAEVARLVENVPAQGIVELAGPERRSMAEFVGTLLAYRGDPRQVLADPTVGYFGVPIQDDTLVPSGAARLGHITLQAWSDRLVSA